MKIINKGFARGQHKKALLLFKKGNYRAAADICLEILNHKHDDTITVKVLVCCLFLEDKHREARSYLEEALSYASGDPELTNLLALTYLKESNVQQAIEKILDAQELRSDILLSQTLDKIKNLKDPDHAKNISLIPMIQLTLPNTGIFSPKISSGFQKYRVVFSILFVILLLNVFYPSLRNFVLNLNIRNRQTIAPNVSIKGINSIVDARENFRIVLDEKVIVHKFEELKQAISDQHPNKARILVNELLASNASLAVKERVGILEGFIVESSVDNIDYIPKYAEIAVAPAVYEGIMLRWNGTVANIYHQGRKTTTFDLLINFVGQGQVEGMALVEVDGFYELNNGDKVTVMGPVAGITKDNRIIMKGDRILTQ
ncbi:MAG: tetratricopeptide repeat protein [Brevinema sp.]